MLQVQVPLAGLPIRLVCIMDATVGFIRTSDFQAVLDIPEDENGIDAVFYNENFYIGHTEYKYNTAYPYKNIPEMLQWLQQQKLEMPEFN